jgi:S1-C subfamily serine protease
LASRADAREGEPMPELVEQFSDSLAAVVERTGPSVLRVEGRRHRAASGVAWSEDVVVTTHHALEWDEITVGLPEGKTDKASLVGRDPGTDLAALRVHGARLVPGSWTDLDGLKVGHLVLAISRPGRTAQARLGIVAALADGWRTPSGGKVDRYLQTDISMHHGFSGSALVDMGGRVRGLNTAGLLRGTATAMPAATVRRVVESLLAHGQVRRGYLGIGAQPVRLPGGAEGGQAAALLVSSVQADSPASRAGLMLGDVLLALDGHPLTHPADLLPLLDEERIGAASRARVLRGGEVREVEVVVAARPERD